MKNDSFKITYIPTTNFGNCKDELLMTAAIDLFQDSAGKHASLISESNESLQEKGYYWVLVRSRVEFLKETPINNKLTVKTYQSSIAAASYEREYFLTDEKENLLVKGDSKWCVIDKNNGKIVPTSKLINDNSCIDEKAFDVPFKKIPLMELFDRSFNYKVLYTDIDHNNHMNNTKYINPLINYFKKNIKKIEINYLKQSYLDDVLKYCISEIGFNQYYVYIYNQEKELVNKAYVELFE